MALSKNLRDSVARNFVCVCIFAFLATCGCSERRGLVPIEATFTLDGKPLEFASVTFLRIDSQQSRPASGMTQSDGSVSMTTYRQGDGVMPGEYKVCVSKRGGVSMPSSGMSVVADRSTVQYESRANGKIAGSRGPVEPQITQVVPEVYGNAENTPLRCVVPFDENELVFNLVSDRAQ
jgi:hypothetical protein